MQDNTPVWTPKNPEASNMYQFMLFVQTRTGCACTDYYGLHRWSIEEPALFWGLVAEYFKLQLTPPHTEIVNQYKHPLDARWFPGTTMNYAAELLRADDGKVAIVAINEQGSRQSFTFKALKEAVAACQEGLRKANIQAGDRVVGVMPNCAQTIIAFLATASLGAIWASCSPDFGIEAILDRLGQIEPKLLFIADGHSYMGKEYSAFQKIEALAKAIPSLQKIVIYPFLNKEKPSNLPKNTLFWDSFMSTKAPLRFTMLPFEHPLYILFSSGTTGKPKCIIHGAGNALIQHVKELGLHTNLNSTDNLCFFTTCGWMMWNWMVSALALGTTITLYEGAPTYPTSLRLFQLIDAEKVTVFGTSAKFISSIEKETAKPIDHYPMQALKNILSTGSPLLPHHYDFVEQHIKHNIQLSSISGGTDIVSCFALGNPLLPVYRGALQCLGLGMDVQVFNDAGKAVFEEKGELVCKNAFPSMPIGFWNDPLKKAYKSSYFSRFEGVWTHRDFAEITKNQGLIIYGRSDAVLNPGGVRIGTAEIYRQIEGMDAIEDAVVIGQNWQDDIRIILFVKLVGALKLDAALEKDIRARIRNNASPRHVPAKIIHVLDIPHTLNGKLVELAVRQVVHGEQVSHLESLANPASLDYFKNLKELTY